MCNKNVTRGLILIMAIYVGMWACCCGMEFEGRASVMNEKLDEFDSVSNMTIRLINELMPLISGYSGTQGVGGLWQFLQNQQRETAAEIRALEDSTEEHSIFIRDGVVYRLDCRI